MGRQAALRLHVSQKNWETCANILRDKADLTMQLKTCIDVQTATNNSISLLQEAAQEAAPAQNPLRLTYSTPNEIKRLVAVKRKARSTWHKTHSPEDRRLFNNASNKLKAALHEMRNASFAAYVSTLKRDDHSFSKPFKSRKKPQITNITPSYLC